MGYSKIKHATELNYIHMLLNHVIITKISYLIDSEWKLLLLIVAQSPSSFLNRSTLEDRQAFSVIFQLTSAAKSVDWIKRAVGIF